MANRATPSIVQLPCSFWSPPQRGFGICSETWAGMHPSANCTLSWATSSAHIDGTNPPACPLISPFASRGRSFWGKLSARHPHCQSMMVSTSLTLGVTLLPTLAAFAVKTAADSDGK